MSSEAVPRTLVVAYSLFYHRAEKWTVSASYYGNLVVRNIDILSKLKSTE